MSQSGSVNDRRRKKKIYKTYGIKIQSVQSYSKWKLGIFYLMIFALVLFISGYELKLLNTEILIDNIIREGINYDAFREMKVNEAALKKADKNIKHLLEKNPDLKDRKYLDRIGYLTFSMMACYYDLIDHEVVDDITFYRAIGKVSATESFRELYSYYQAVLSDLEYFPVPRVQSADIFYDNTWYEHRSYGGNRRHEGSDLMASNNQRGYFPIISITDGIVEKMGWLEQGGYRIGIRSNSGGYFYYAHLYSYVTGLKEGDEVIAGQLLGFMGDSGYGKEGTIGQFDVHLHLGIYVDAISGEMSINPYWILHILEKYRTKYASVETNGSFD